MTVRGRRGGAAHLHLHLADAGNLAEQTRGHAVHRGLGGGRLAREGQRHRHAVGVDREVAHETERDDVFLGLGITDPAKRVENLLLDVLYELPTAKPGMKYVVTEEMVRRQGPVLPLTEGGAKKQRKRESA